MKTNMKTNTKSEINAKTKTNTLHSLRKGIAIVLVATVFLLAGCSSAKLSGDFEEEKVKAAAREAVECLAAGEYEACVALMSAEIQEAISAEILGANMETITAQKGAFQEIKSVSVVGQKDKDGTEYAVAVVVGSFEKGNVTFTVSYDKGMQIIGFWMK